MSVSHTRQIGRLVGGRYRLVSLLGAGGMGTVYRAVHVNMGKDFAVKLLRPELSRTEEAARRFEREAEAASRLTHPGCVRVTDFGRDDGTLFLVMERLDGRTLASLLAETPRLAPGRAVHVAVQVLDAISHAHAEGIVHRDLKPENVMLVRVDDDPDHVKLCDFGLARLAAPGDESGITDAGSVFGTPEYLSPEQALGEPADGRADLYAVGVMLFEMLAGRRPFVGATRSELLAAHLTREPPDLGEIVTDGSIPVELAAIVATALRKRKAERWLKAEDFRDALLAASPGVMAAPALSSLVPVGTTRLPEVEQRTRLFPGRGEPSPIATTVNANDARASAPSAPAASDPNANDPNLHVLGDPQPEDREPDSGAREPESDPGAAVGVGLGATGAPARRLGLPFVAAGIALLALVILLAAVASSSDSRGGASPSIAPLKAAPSAELEDVRTALRKGDVKGSRAAAERLARAFPDDVRAYVLLGDVLFSQRQTERGLAAYREAARMDRVLASGHDELRANLLATFDDEHHGAAARALADELGLSPPAKPVQKRPR